MSVFLFVVGIAIVEWQRRRMLCLLSIVFFAIIIILHETQYRPSFRFGTNVVYVVAFVSLELVPASHAVERNATDEIYSTNSTIFSSNHIILTDGQNASEKHKRAG